MRLAALLQQCLTHPISASIYPKRAFFLVSTHIVYIRGRSFISKNAGRSGSRESGPTRHSAESPKAEAQEASSGREISGLGAVGVPTGKLHPRIVALRRAKTGIAPGAFTLSTSATCQTSTARPCERLAFYRLAR